MRVLLISTKPQRLNGGIAVWTDKYISRCAEFGIDCTLVNTEVIGKRGQIGTAKRNFKDEFVRTKRIFKDLKAALKSQPKAEAAHLNTSCGTFGLIRDYLIASRIHKKGIQVVTHYHCDIPFWIHNGLSRWFLGKLASISAKNLVLCENSRKYLEEQFGIDSVKIPNFIEVDTVRSDEKKIRETIQKVFFVGRVEEAKGVAEIYELARRLPEITFELAGEVNEAVAQWEKPKNIELLGPMPHEQVLQCMDDADLFLLPSHSEGFSIALVESMARGLPAIATDVGAAADMLADGCGIVVPRGDVDAMEQAICQMKDADRRAAISQTAVAKTKATYTVEAVLTRIRQCYL